MYRIARVSFAISLCLSSSLTAADWPQFRGQDRDGRSSDTGLMTSWPDAGPPLLWRSSGVGNGYSSLASQDSTIYTTGDIDGKQHLMALAASDGSLEWKTEIGPAWEDQYLGARSTPTVAGDLLVVLSTEGEVLAADRMKGNILWRRNLRSEFGGGLMQAMGKYDWKYSESALVDGDRVIVTPGGSDAAIVALDLASGKELWRAAVPANIGEEGADGAGYSSAVISEAGGVRHYVQLVGRGLLGVDAENGEVLWSYNRVANKIANCSTPLIDGDRVFASTGYETGAAAIELSSAQGDGISARELYFLESDTFQNHHGNMILHDGFVYAGSGHKKGFPMAIHLASGKVAWGPIRNDGRGSAVVIYADGHLYFRYENGLMVLIEANSEKYVEKGSFMIPDVEQFSWSMPIIADNVMYLREQDNLFAYDLSVKN